MRKAIAAIDPKPRLGERVLSVTEQPDGVTVATASGAERFDHAVVAVHGDQARGLLTEPDALQRETLSRIRYNSSVAVLHTDPSVMPADRSRWDNWNYGRATVGGEVRPYAAYYMNRLHGFTSEQDYFVTLDCPLTVREESVIRELHYEHPVIDLDLGTLQKTIYRVNEGTRIKLCGSYFHSKQLHYDQIGSHEAAFSSGLEAAEQLLRGLGR
ncbi:FAD-dependent oxidoreductase [Kitasatospora sp. KL5]|uniref:FAD-dependent oxidoreductase n=1 Tax=Kitasatospora sp. KL5 TaxID=3425125 RepID=UPI003D6E69F0